MLAIDRRVDPFKERHSFLMTFVKAVGECNQVIYEEAIVEPCCTPDQDGFDDNSSYSDSTASETVRDDIVAKEIIVNMQSVVAASFGNANGAFRPVNNDNDKNLVDTTLGHSKRAYTHVNDVNPKHADIPTHNDSPINDDGPKELTNAGRSRSMRRSRSASPNKRSRELGRSRSMGRGRDKDPIRGSSPMRRSTTISPQPTRTRSPRRALSPQRQSSPAQRKSKTPKREGLGKKKSEAAPTTTKHRQGPPATSKATRVFSALRKRAFGKPKRSASTPRKPRTPKREGSGKKKSEAAPPTTKHREEPPATPKATRASPALRAGGKSSKNKSKGGKQNKNKPTQAVPVDAVHPMTRTQSRHRKSNTPSPPKREEKVFEANPRMKEDVMTFSHLDDAGERRGFAMF